jgi:DhnA family fructose-bisphosphate aldolase class Ia
VDAEPVGAYVVRDREVEWQPVFDLSALVRRGQLLGMVALLVIWVVVKALRSR